MNDINTSFKAFTDFARAQMAAGNDKAVARFDLNEGSFHLEQTRTISAATDDKAFALFRSDEAKAANVKARDAFMKSVVEIFGSKKNIPKSVMDQMTNFDTSKPLTARRITAISDAIDDFRKADFETLKKSALSKIAALHRVGVLTSDEVMVAKLAIGDIKDYADMRSAENEYENKLSAFIEKEGGLSTIPDDNVNMLEATYKDLKPKFAELLHKLDVTSITDKTVDGEKKLFAEFCKVGKMLNATGPHSTRGIAKALYAAFIEDPILYLWVATNVRLVDSTKGEFTTAMFNYGDDIPGYEEICAKFDRGQELTKAENSVISDRFDFYISASTFDAIVALSQVFGKTLLDK